jgi:hypothetical protein
LSACGPIGAGAVLAAISATIYAAIPATASVYLTGAVFTGKRAGNAGAVQDESYSCQEQDQCNYWIFIHHFVPLICLNPFPTRQIDSAISIYISLCKHHNQADSIIYSGEPIRHHSRWKSDQIGRRIFHIGHANCNYAFK